MIGKRQTVSAGRCNLHGTTELEKKLYAVDIIADLRLVAINVDPLLSTILAQQQNPSTTIALSHECSEKLLETCVFWGV
jgi:hypothetical protein